MAASKEENGASMGEPMKDFAVSPNPKERNEDHRQESAFETPQRSPLSRTADEIQKSVFSTPKSFGSFNMEELLSNIWNREEGNITASDPGDGDPDFNEHHPKADGQPAAEPKVTAIGGRSTSTAIHGKSSAPVTAALGRKTVDEVWSTIHEGHEQHREDCSQQQQDLSSDNSAREPTLRSMALEDSLAKARAAREGSNFLLFTQHNLGQSQLSERLHESHHLDGIPGIHLTEAMPESAPAASLARHDHQLLHATTVVGAHRNTAPLFSVGSSVIPISSDGFGGGWGVGWSNLGGQWTTNVIGGSSSRGGGDGAAGAPSGSAVGKKRKQASTLELLIERRQKRLIKNRDSAARSRARKQVPVTRPFYLLTVLLKQEKKNVNGAYIVELEAELNQLKEENARLVGEELRLSAQRRQMLMLSNTSFDAILQLLESITKRSQIHLQRKTNDPRKCSSCRW
ncbi:unnamed protein product [Spirodela intermedia]|uniref:BZIP domain-containing protein n=1 Tax=Spirodela intermedia TaxID=51605 RepID=A0A7I8KGU7_SPIIN|nr:unnamed protein product [Spirodela intermedia]